MSFPRDSADPVKRGDKVRVPKGTLIHSTHPRYREKIAGTSYTVKVFDYMPGYPEDHYGPGKAPYVEWVGTGGYWHSADFADVEVLP